MGCTTREKSIRNKRMLRTNKPAMPVKNLADGKKNNGIVAETAPKSMKMLNDVSGEEKPKDKELGFEETEEFDLGYCTEEKLHDLLLKSIEYNVNEAVCTVAAKGYSGEDALKAVLLSDHHYGNGELVSDIVENAKTYLKNSTSKNFNAAENVSRDLKQLQEDALNAMVCSVRQLRPEFSKRDAMRSLLTSDLHVGRASALEITSMPPADKRIIIKSNGNKSNNPFPVISMPSQIKPSCSSSNCRSVAAVSEPYRMCVQRKIISGLNVGQADTAVADASFSPCNGFIFDAGTSQTPTSNAQFAPDVGMPSSMQLSLSRGNPAALFHVRHLHNCQSNSDLCSQSHGRNNEGSFSTRGPGNVQIQSGNSHEKDQLLTQDMNPHIENASDSISVVAAATELSLGIASSGDAGQDQCKTSDIVGAILGSQEQMGTGEKSDGIDQRNEVMLKLMHHIRELEMQLKDRTEWAQQRAMQAARKLSKDLAELKQLRMERDETLRLKKDKQALEDTRTKRLAEMESELRKVSGDIDQNNAAVKRLETENAELRAETEACNLNVAESVTKCQELEKREKRAQNSEKQKSKLQDETNDVKQDITRVQQQLSLVRDIQQETEAKLKQEEKAKEIAIMQAEKERRAKDDAEASARRRVDALHKKMEIDVQRYKDDIERLEQELTHLKTTAKLCQSNTMPNAPNAVDKAKHKGLQGSSRSEVNSDRKCFMCTNEEVSVVFVPCAHQVVCVKCNDSHEKQGLKNCPFCKSLIQQRIHVYGVHL